jgi:drug/metabolite transporter (DMT)-like permease
MPFLIAASLIFALSPGLIKGRLGDLDNTFVTAARLGLALIVFGPFLRAKGLSVRTMGSLLGIGAVQFGLMYLAYIESFRYLAAYEVALFTITTPIFVTLFADLLDRKLHRRALLAAVVAIVGAAVVRLDSGNLNLSFIGLALVQLSNLAFAIGQVLYQRLRVKEPQINDGGVFALLYAGGFMVALTALMFSNARVTLTARNLTTLLYLGVIASGVGFFLWNMGAVRVKTATLAVMNNLKIPLMIAASLFVFAESANLPRLIASLVIMGAAVWLAESRRSAS